MQVLLAQVAQQPMLELPASAVRPAAVRELEEQPASQRQTLPLQASLDAQLRVQRPLLEDARVSQAAVRRQALEPRTDVLRALPPPSAG